MSIGHRHSGVRHCATGVPGWGSAVTTPQFVDRRPPSHAKAGLHKRHHQHPQRRAHQHAIHSEAAAIGQQHGKYYG
ncbi:MAG TPA: hypothetical protein VF510_08640 [Ktedonobacterales bacterium]